MSDWILLVEDNEQNRELATYLLEEAGFAVRCASDADAARAALTGEPPAAIVMDIQLPGTDGLALVAELRAREELRATPMIAVSAHAMRGDRERSIAAGCSGHITKPISVSEFANQIRSFVAGKRDA